MKWKVIMGVTISAMVIAAGAVVAAAPFVASAQTAATAVPGAAATSPTPYGNGQQAGDPQADLPGLQESDLLNSAAASVTGLTAQDVISQTQAGQSLAQIAIAKGKTAADVIASARVALSTGLAKAVTAGTITQADSDAELAEFDTRAPQMVANPEAHGQPGGFGDHGRGGPQTEMALVNATASVTGLTAAEVISQTQAGQSLTQIATAKGKTAADIITAARASLSTQLAAAVTAGKLTQAQSDAQLAQFDQQAPAIVASTSLQAKGGRGFGPGGQRGPGGIGGPGGAGALINAAASVTGLTDQEIDTQLQAGQTLAQIAQSKGKTADDVIAAARTALTTQLQAAVTAGKLTQAQSDARLAQFNTSATQLVNDATLGRHQGGHGGGGHFGGPGGPNDSDGTTAPGNPAPTTAAPSSTTSS